MGRSYPYIQDTKKLKTGECHQCGKKEGIYLVEQRYGWFQDDTDAVEVCKKHLNDIRERHKKRDEHESIFASKLSARQLERQIETIESIERNLSVRWNVKVFTPYHLRVEGVLDIYPTNRRYHYLPTGKRGTYTQNVYDLVRRFIPE